VNVRELITLNRSRAARDAEAALLFLLLVQKEQSFVQLQATAVFEIKVRLHDCSAWYCEKAEEVQVFALTCEFPDIARELTLNHITIFTSFSLEALLCSADIFTRLIADFVTVMDLRRSVGDILDIVKKNFLG